jgi:hypothetical protein
MRIPSLYTAPVVAGILVALTLSSCCNTRPPEKYAVLVSTEQADGETQNNAEFWYDVVLTYRTLVRDGFRPENIVVLYGDGKPFTSVEHPAYKALACNAGEAGSSSNAIVPLTGGDGLIVKDNICNVLCCMATGRPAVRRNGTCSCASSTNSEETFSCSAWGIPKPAARDFLFVWVKGHGSAVGNEVRLGFPNSGGVLTDKELKGIFDQIAPRRRALLFETCAAGGWLDDFTSGALDDLAGRGTVTLTASGKPDGPNRWNESSYPLNYPERTSAAGAQTTEVLHGRFTYWVNAALQREGPSGTAVASDLDGNALVSMVEAYDLTSAEINQENGTLPDDRQQHPAISTRRGVAACVFLSLSEPGWYCRICCSVPSH